MIVGERISARLEEKGWSQAELARRVKVSQNTIWSIVKGKSHNSVHLLAIAKALDVSIDYLIGENGDPSTPSDTQLPEHARGPVNDPDLVQVQEFEIGLGMGGGGFLEGHIPGTPRTFSRTWLRQFTRAEPQYLLWTTGIGDSMTPTIGDQDVMLIDTSDQVPRIADKIWAIALGGMGMVKRLRTTKDGTGMRIMSDNPAVPEEIAFDGEMNVIGRIVAIVRRV